MEVKKTPTGGRALVFINSEETRFDNLSVLRNNSRPSTLIELGFLTNNKDDSVVESSDYRDKVAQGVYQGLLDYF